MRQDVSEEQKTKPNLEHRVKDTVKMKMRSDLGPTSAHFETPKQCSVQKAAVISYPKFSLSRQWLTAGSL